MIDFRQNFNIVLAVMGWSLANQAEVLREVAKVDWTTLDRHVPLE